MDRKQVLRLLIGASRLIGYEPLADAMRAAAPGDAAAIPNYEGPVLCGAADTAGESVLMWAPSVICRQRTKEGADHDSSNNGRGFFACVIFTRGFAGDGG
jgi:hypothetical protein